LVFEHFRTYWKNVRQANLIFGEAEERPQDINPSLRRELMVRNVSDGTSSLTDEQYQTYLQSLETFGEELLWKGKLLDVAKIRNFQEVNKKVICSKDDMDTVLQSIVGIDVLGFDFEFHTQDSYDGKIYMYICICYNLNEKYNISKHELHF